MARFTTDINILFCDRLSMIWVINDYINICYAFYVICCDI